MMEPIRPQQMRVAAQAAMSLVKIIRQRLPIVGESKPKAGDRTIDRWFEEAGTEYATFERIRNPRKQPWDNSERGSFHGSSGHDGICYRGLCEQMERVCETYGWQGLSDETRRPGSIHFQTPIPAIDLCVLENIEMDAEGLFAELGGTPPTSDGNSDDQTLEKLRQLRERATTVLSVIESCELEDATHIESKSPLALQCVADLENARDEMCDVLFELPRVSASSGGAKTLLFTSLHKQHDEDATNAVKLLDEAYLNLFGAELWHRRGFFGVVSVASSVCQQLRDGIALLDRLFPLAADLVTATTANGGSQADPKPELITASWLFGTLKADQLGKKTKSMSQTDEAGDKASVETQLEAPHEVTRFDLKPTSDAASGNGTVVSKPANISKTRFNGAYRRDHVWLDWERVEKLTSPEIRDRWNRLSKEEREQLAGHTKYARTIATGNRGNHHVKTQLEMAASERDEPIHGG